MDTAVTVQGTWNRNGTELVNQQDNGRITISNIPLAMPPYQTTVSFNPLDISDVGRYVCTAMIYPQDTTFITGISSSISRSVTVTSTT